MATTERKIQADIGNNKSLFTLRFPNLAPGQYVGRIVFFEVDEFANEVIHDVVDSAFIIERVNKENKKELVSKWSPQYWGGIDFPSILIEESMHE